MTTRWELERKTSFYPECPSPDGRENPFVPVPIAIGRHKRLEGTAGNSSLKNY